MFYTIYKITNKINQKYYIGMHKTNNLEDGYMGSGKLINFAIKKYGSETFTKEILHVFDNEQDMKNKEKELVVISEDTYNLCDGGHGGFGYINSNKLGDKKEAARKGGAATKGKKKIWVSERIKKSGQHPNFTSAAKISFLGKKHKDESKKLIGEKNSKHQQGTGNSQYNTCWITNGKESVKIKKTELDLWVKKGYYKGRIIRG